jgi:N utilization substance protein B
MPETKNKTTSRRYARELALQIMYAMDASKCSLDEALKGYKKLRFARKRKMTDFALAVLSKCSDDMKTIDERLQSVIEHWRLNRVALIDRNLLRLAATEIFFFDDIPPKVTINEYIEISKIYGDKDSPAFINGILDKIAKTMSSKPLVKE